MLRTSASQQIDVEIKSLMRYRHTRGPDVTTDIYFHVGYYRFRHPNILDVMGFCFSRSLQAIVYRYMEKGSLYQWLHTVCLCYFEHVIAFLSE